MEIKSHLIFQLLIMLISSGLASAGVISVSGNGFYPTDNIAFSSGWGDGGAYIDSGTGNLAAPVYLPQGAVITGFKVFFYNNTAMSKGSKIDVNLFVHSMSIGSFISYAKVDSQGVSGRGIKYVTITGRAPIDNNNYSAVIMAYSTSWQSSNLKIIGAAVTYNLPPTTPATPLGSGKGDTGSIYSYSTSSTDPDGNQLKYIFDWGDGTTSITGLVNSGTSASANHSWSKAGIYQVKARARDSQDILSGWSNSLAIAINTPPNVPSALLGPIWCSPGTLWSFLTHTTDPDGDKVRYTFDWGDGTTSMTGLINSGASASANHSWSKAGAYQIRVNAMDSNGKSSEWSSPVWITINTPPNTPSAPLGPSSGAFEMPYSYSTSATDPDGDKIKYTFDWGDGSTSETGLVNSGTNVKSPHIWYKNDTYFVRAKATDSSGRSSWWSNATAVSISS